MGLFSKKVETRDLDFIVPSELGRDGSYADVQVTPDTALRLSAVWACVRLLADTVSTLPLDTFRGDEEIPAPPLLASPAAGWSLPEWLYAAMVSLLLRGNAYGLITARSGPRLTPAQVELVNPDNLTVNVEANGSVTYRYRGRVIDPSDLWHVRAFVYPGSPVGLSPISYAAETVGLGLATQRFGREFFKSGASPSGILSINAPLSSEQIEMAKFKIFSATHGKREPLIVGGTGTGEAAQWTSLSINPNESQFVESRRLGVAEIARTFGVPPEMVGGEAGGSLTYATVEGRALDFVRYSLTPWMVRLEDAIGGLLPRGQTVKFNVNALLRGTTKERYDAHAVALAAGFLTIDEVRELEDLPPMPAASSPPNLQAVEGTGS
jgi:HK97 family phage portal protein